MTNTHQQQTYDLVHMRDVSKASIEIADDLAGITQRGPWYGHENAMLTPALYMNHISGVLEETIDGFKFYGANLTGWLREPPQQQ